VIAASAAAAWTMQQGLDHHSMSSDAASATSLAETSASRYWVTATSPNITTVVEGPANPFEPSFCTHHRVLPAAHLDQGPPRA
jgi:hypothetical protein